MNGLQDCIVFVIWPGSVLFNLYIKQKNKGFQSEALLQMSISSSTMEEFGLDIQK